MRYAIGSPYCCRCGPAGSSTASPGSETQRGSSTTARSRWPADPGTPSRTACRRIRSCWPRSVASCKAGSCSKRDPMHDRGRSSCSWRSLLPTKSALPSRPARRSGAASPSVGRSRLHRQAVRSSRAPRTPAGKDQAGKPRQHDHHGANWPLHRRHRPPDGNRHWVVGQRWSHTDPRQKLEADPAALRHLLTEPGLGFRCRP